MRGRQLAALGINASADLVDLDRVAVAAVRIPVVDEARACAVQLAAVALDGDVVQSGALGQLVAVVQPVEHQLDEYALCERVDLAERLAPGVRDEHEQLLLQGFVEGVDERVRSWSAAGLGQD